MPSVLLANRETIAEAARVLRAGGLVAFPTETVYGLGARVFDEAAVARVFAAKGRPHAHPLIAHVTTLHAAKALAASWSETCDALAHAFWPGPLTLVVKRAAHVPAIVAGGGDSIAVRSPSHPIARALIDAVGDAIAAPSANRYQSLSPTLAAHVVKSLGDAVDLVIDGGACDAGIESTVVDVRGPSLVVLRPGAIALEALAKIDPHVTLAGSVVMSDDARPSPGMDARHYAPRATLLVARDRAHAVALAASHGTRAALVLRGAPLASPLSNEVRVLADDPTLYAHDFFAALHALEDHGVNTIILEAVPDEPAWVAVADRIRRGSTT